MSTRPDDGARAVAATDASAMGDAERGRIRAAAEHLRRAERPLRVLRSLAWAPAVRDTFFARGAERLPEVEYPRLDPATSFAEVAAARALVRDETDPIDAWLLRQATAIETAARMLAAVGTAELYVHSRALYGAPRDPLPDDLTSSLGLAQALDDTFSNLVHVDLGGPAPACHLATTVAEAMRRAVERFGDQAPEVVIVDELSANALAGAGQIRLRRTACFSDRDIEQLIHHEAYIHVATTLNGQAQEDLPILVAGHAGTTRTQEGLAVFAELTSATLDPHRLRRLAERVLAIQMAIDGADFLEVYRWFLGRGTEPEQAFENARRVFRGGLLTGGAPFTKDIVYLDGLLRVHNFLRTAVVAGRSDCIRLLFCGKLAIEDVPALGLLAQAGLCRPPRFLPPWAEDLRFLVAYLTYSSFLNRVDLGKLRTHFAAMLAATPRLSRRDLAAP